MKKKNQPKPARKGPANDQQRAMRRNQIIFGVIAVILILSMALSMIRF